MNEFQRLYCREINNHRTFRCLILNTKGVEGKREGLAQIDVVQCLFKGLNQILQISSWTATYSREAAGRKVVTLDSYLNRLHVLDDGQVLDVLQTRSLRPIPAINGHNLHSTQILRYEMVHFGRSWRSGCSDNQDVTWLKDCKLVAGPRIELIVTNLTENCFTRSDVDECHPDSGSDTTTFADRTYDLLRFSSSNDGAGSRSTTCCTRATCAWAVGVRRGRNSVYIGVRCRGKVRGAV